MKATFRKISRVLAACAIAACVTFGSVDTQAYAINVPQASGTQVYSGNGAEIDASNSSDGYVMIRYTGSSTAKLKVIIEKSGGTKYTYNLNTAGKHEVFPLTDGNGSYSIGVHQNTSGTKYTTLLSQSITASISNEFAPYLLTNQYVNYSPTSKTVAKAAELVSGASTDIDKITKVYEYVVSNFTYDKAKASSVQSGYLPDVDKVLAEKKGICFDYAAVMAAMLRSQGIPTRLVVGYAGEVYHAWISTYTKEKGWVENIIQFDGTSWKLMDPTFASSSKSSPDVMKYIGNGSNYKQKFVY